MTPVSIMATLRPSVQMKPDRTDYKRPVFTQGLEEKTGKEKRDGGRREEKTTEIESSAGKAGKEGR